MFGLLNINKPSGITSRTAVNRVARLVRGTKIGHAGTLDPLAEGVLIICLGQATRLVPFVHQCSKRYVATYLLGRSSPTDDVDGDVTVIESGNAPSEAEIRSDVRRLHGHHSATSAGVFGSQGEGRTCLRDSKAWRRRAAFGQAGPHPPDRATRLLLSAIDSGCHVRHRNVLAFAWSRYRCHTRNGCHHVGLRRTEIGPFHIDASCRLESLTPVTLATELQPAIRAVAHLPQVELSAQQVTAVRHGHRIGGPNLALGLQVAAIHAGNQLVAVMEVTADSQLKPVRVFG